MNEVDLVHIGEFTFNVISGLIAFELIGRHEEKEIDQLRDTFIPNGIERKVDQRPQNSQSPDFEQVRNHRRHQNVEFGSRYWTLNQGEKRGR